MSEDDPLIARSAIREAAGRIAGYVRRTPLLALEPGLAGLPGQLVLKLEYLQPTGSFKPRGAFSLLTEREIPPPGVAAASGGNFGLAVAYAARELGVAANIFVPDSSPAAKIARLAGYGANVHVIPGYYADALEASRRWVQESGALFAHAYDQPEVVAGQGTCGLELTTQMSEFDTIIVAVGGGGLIAGIASWIRDGARVIGVETHGTPTLSAAFEAGAPVDVEVEGLAASALGAGRLGRHAWAARRWIERALLVSDQEVERAQRWLWEQARIVVEPAAATPLAAVLSGAYVPAAKEAVVLVICGANVDPGTVA